MGLHSTHTHTKLTTTRSIRPAIDPEAARVPPPSHRGRARVPAPRARPPHIRAALPSPPGRMPSPLRLRQRPQKPPRRTCQRTRNRSMPTCDHTAPPWPSAVGSCAPQLARAPALATQPADMAESAVGQCSSRCLTGSHSRSSSRVSTRSTKICTRICGPPTAPSSVRYRSAIGRMIQSCFRARIDAQPSTCRSVMRTRHQMPR